MEQAVWKAALAGLLHDVGKFAQRAGARGGRIWDAQSKADFGYYHALLTDDFCQNYVPQPWLAQVRRMAASHHRPQDHDDQIIRLADRLSAGERADPVDDQAGRTAHPRQLQSILTLIEIDGDKAPGPAYWPLARLEAARQALFPAAALPETEVWSRYRALWDEFCEQAAALRDAHTPAGNLAVYLESLLLLMQRYLWCMPSAYYKAVPDVSLLDHSRMTAALAALLAGSPPETLTALTTGNLEDNTTPVALLVGGDLSGVQDFIYTITSRGATPGLRGRSFYLQMLVEAAVRLILRRLDLPITNLVYAGGGNFYLLVRPADADALVEIQREISRALHRHHRAALYLAIAQTPLRAADFFGGRVGRVWDRLGCRLMRAKQRRFVELGQGLRDLFAPEGRGGNESHECQVTGLEHPDVVVDEGVRKSPAVLSYEDVGDRLRRARYLLLRRFEPRPAVRDLGDCHEALGELGFGFALADAPGSLPTPAGAETQTALALDDDGMLALRPLANRAVGRRMFVNVTPTVTPDQIAQARRRGIPDLPKTDREVVKPFSLLEDDAEGIKRLGVLRMDVDNLGRIFAEGLDQRATLSRVASLSAAISFYFEGYVDTLAREVDGGRNVLYSIYSGGDDLFFVGAWPAVVALAQRVRYALTEYAGGHPGLHVSGGVALAGSKYPLYQAAEDAHQAERAAKTLRRVVDGRARDKDAFAFLGQALPWERFGPADARGLDTAAGLYAFLRALARDSQNKALIAKLAAQYLAYREAEQRRREAGADQTRNGVDQPLYGPWHWRTEYLLAQQGRRMGEHRAQIDALRRALHDDAYRGMAWLGLAARWAQLSLRQ